MAYQEPITALPSNNDNCNIKMNLFGGVMLESTYTSANQIFTLTDSGMEVPAYLILEWEIITP